jgi:GNAT superfamily N-acetyltransferase
MWGRMNSQIRASPEILIRMAELDDIPTIISNNLEMAMETEARALDHAVAAKGTQRLIDDPSKGFYILAEVSGQVVGQCMITFEWSDWRNGNFWWLQSVYVVPKFRGQGIFSSIYQHMLAEAKGRDDVVGLRLYVEKENRSAREVYGHLGIKKSHYEMYEIDFTKP